MKRTNAWGAMGLVMAMGMVVPGCFLFGSDEEEGRMKVTDCVRAERGIAELYQASMPEDWT